MDSDIESQYASVIPIFFVLPLKFPPGFELTLFNWKKFMIILWIIQCMFFASFTGLMKPKWGTFAKVCIITGALTPFLGYAMVLLNMFNGGWGREESRFWCHMRIMYLAGYNSMRWVIAAIVDPCLVGAVCYLIKNDISYAIWAASSIIYAYYIMSTLEMKKSKPIQWEKYENDFDVKLQSVHEIQKTNINPVNVNSIVLSGVLSIFSWVSTGWNIGFFLLSYNICMFINAYLYVSSTQTFVITDTQYDIIQFVFRTLILWSFIWI